MLSKAKEKNIVNDVIDGFIHAVNLAQSKDVKKHAQDWIKRVHESGEGLLKALHDIKIPGKRDEASKKHFLAGSLIGILLGAGTGLALSPKTSKQIRKNISNSYNDITGKSHDIIEFLKKSYVAQKATKAKTTKTTKKTTKTKKAAPKKTASKKKVVSHNLKRPVKKKVKAKSRSAARR